MKISEGIKEWLLKNRILLIVAAVLGLFLILDTTFFRPKEKPKNKLLNFNMTDIVSFKIQNKEGVLSFVRKGSDWLIENVSVKPGKEEIDSFLDDIRQISFRRKIETTDEDAFGLKNYDSLIEINTKDKNFRLVKGNTTPSGNDFYLGFEGNVYIVERNFSELFSKTLFSFRDKKIVDARADYVRKISISWQNKDLNLAKNRTIWTNLKGGTVPLEDVNSFLFELESLKAKDFISGQKINQSYFGFPSNNKLKLVLADGSSFSLEIGIKDKDGVVLSRNFDMQELIRADSYFLTTLSNYVHLFMSKSLNGVTNEIK